MLHVTADSLLLWGIKYYTLHSSCHQQNRFHQLTASQEQFLVQASQCGLLGEGQSYAMGNVLWNPVLSCCVILVEVCRFIFEKGLLEKELLMNLQTFSFCNGRKMWWYADSKDLLGYMAVQNLAMKSKAKKLALGSMMMLLLVGSLDNASKSCSPFSALFIWYKVKQMCLQQSLFWSFPFLK